MEKAGNYYAGRLNAKRLAAVYDTELPRIRRYLAAEIDYARRAVTKNDQVLELGAGYGRVMRELAPYAACVTGIDISEDSVRLGREYLADCPNCRLLVMDAHSLAFGPEFDLALCMQNGLSALKGDPAALIVSALAVLRPGGRMFCGVYSPKFWDQRLAWFREQAAKGLLGAIDEERTRDGVIVCRDGFSARSFSREELEALGVSSGCSFTVDETDESSLFLVLQKPL